MPEPAAEKVDFVPSAPKGAVEKRQVAASLNHPNRLKPGRLGPRRDALIRTSTFSAACEGMP